MRRSTLTSLLTVATLCLALGLPAAGCKDKSGGDGKGKSGDKGGKVGSCDRTKNDGYCTEWGQRNFDAAGEDYLKKFCKTMQGEFKLAPCPTAKSVGTCATPEGTKVYYSEGGYKHTPEKAEKSCKEGVPAGKWKAAK